MLCALCREYERQEISHIIPAFVYKKLRQLSPSGFSRTTLNPNRRVQDGEKYPLLCPNCEDLFSVWEKKFAENVFHPYYASQKNTFSFNYDEWFLKFLVSISYRSLVNKLENEGVDDHSKLCVKNMREAKGIWKDFLLNKRKNIGLYRQYFLILPIQTETESLFLKYNNGLFNFYLLTATDANTIFAKDDSEAYLITKFGECFVIATLIDSNPSQWKSLVTKSTGGIFKWNTMVQTSPLVINYIEYAIKDIIEAQKNLSPVQTEKIRLSVERYIKDHSI